MEILSIIVVPAANKNSISSPKNTLYYSVAGELLFRLSHGM